MDKVKKLVEKGWAIKSDWGNTQHFFPLKIFYTREEARLYKTENSLGRDYKIVWTKIMEDEMNLINFWNVAKDGQKVKNKDGLIFEKVEDLGITQCLYDAMMEDEYILSDDWETVVDNMEIPLITIPKT